MDNSKSRKMISVKNLSVTFNDIKKGLKALEDINLTVDENEFVTIIGPSGSGKSTLFRALADILNGQRGDNVEVEGDIEIDGLPVKRARKDRKIGVVFQKPTLLEWRNIQKNVELPLEIVEAQGRAERSEELLDLVELSEYKNFRPSQLSGGMQQRVSIARALAFDPPVLLMDEPFSALDEITRRSMNDELIEIWQDTKKTILFITHSIEEAVYLSQRIVVMTKRPGKVKKEIEINLPYPRTKQIDSQEFFKYITKVRKEL